MCLLLLSALGPQVISIVILFHCLLFCALSGQWQKTCLEAHRELFSAPLDLMLNISAVFFSHCVFLSRICIWLFFFFSCFDDLHLFCIPGLDHVLFSRGHCIIYLFFYCISTKTIIFNFFSSKS